MRVAIKVDGNKKLGLGHVMRCLAVAKQLKKNKIRVIFIIGDNSIKKIIENEKFFTYFLDKREQEPKSIKKIIISEKINVIIIDSKKNTLNNILKNIPSKTKIVFIDNIKYQNKSDLIVLPGIKEQFTNIPKNSISGLEYILLNPNIRKTKNRKERNTILLSTGGSDKYNITEKIVKNFMKFNKKFKMKIILGELYEHKDKLKKMVEDDKRFDVYIQPKEISKIMNSCTIGIVTFGVTVYEAAYLHLPIFVIAHSNENHKAAMQVEKYGWSKYLGKYDKINYKDMAKMIFKYINDERTLEKMKNNGVVDGKGNKRVVEKIIKLF